MFRVYGWKMGRRFLIGQKVSQEGAESLAREHYQTTGFNAQWYKWDVVTVEDNSGRRVGFFQPGFN